MHQPRFLARGLLVSFLLIALLAAPGALTFTWAGAAAVNQAGTQTPTTTGTPNQTATATSTAPSLSKFTGLQAAPLAACSGTTVAQWNFDANSMAPSAGTGTMALPIDVTGPVMPYPTDNASGLALGSLNWPTGTSPDTDRYLKIDVSTVGRDEPSLGFDYNSDAGGPTKLDLYYSATGGDPYKYVFTWNLTPLGSWGTASTYIFDTVAVLDDNANASFKLRAYGASDSSKMLRLDNIAVSGNCIVVPPPVRFTISDHAGVGGATLRYKDITDRTVDADGTGFYTFDVPSGWTGRVTPSKPGYVFDPPYKDYSGVTVDISQDYTPTVSCGGAPTPGEVLINEIGWGGTTYNSSDEWIELHSTNTACSIDLTGWSLKGLSSGGHAEFNILFTAGDSIGLGGYFVIVKYSGTFNTNVHESKVDGTLSLLNYGETLYLYGPSPPATRIDTANCHDAACDGTIVDPWPAGSSYPVASMERYLDTADTREDWVTYNGPLDTSPLAPTDSHGNPVRGTPGRANWTNQPGNAPTVVPPTPKIRKPTPIPPTPFAHMVINEFLPRAGTDWNRDGAINVYDEFIELKNLGPISVNLSSWKLDNGGNLPDSYTLPSMTLKTGERALFYRSTTNIPLEDSGGTVRLLNPSGIIFDARGYGPVASPDVSHCRIPDGYYWQDACFPTPGTENSLTGSAASPPPIAAVLPPPCLLPDTAPLAFRVGECAPYGSDIWDRTYWDDPAGSLEFLIQDLFSKWKTIVQ